jgi:cysteinyl-tRNA synthetase
MIQLFNTLSGKKERFVPIRGRTVGMYNCGPTVYNYAHIGNLRAYVFADILRRTLEYNGYKVKQIINITDVGHLTSEADLGEDKIEQKAKLERKSAKEISQYYTKTFFDDLKKLNINTKKTKFPRATGHIKEQIKIIKTLEQKGFTYKTSDGVYFDTAKYESYGKLGNINIEGLREGARVEANSEKRRLTDFALWKFSPTNERREQEWPSPWGVGFPGWHIECSAMSMKYLGETFDIHTGGIDHIPIHHNNEIAQSEAATGRPFVRFWLHNAHVTIDGSKMAKSEGNFLTLNSLSERGISPLSYRYWLLGAIYSTPLSFSKEGMDGAENAFRKLTEHFINLGRKTGRVNREYEAKFREGLNDNLNTPVAISVLWQMLQDQKVSAPDKRSTMLSFDKVLGLNLEKIKIVDIPRKVKRLLAEREMARKKEDWQKSDKLRDKIKKLGYEVKDTENGPVAHIL